MQGGIRRKKDLLPRYKKKGGFNNNRNGSYLTTPMKKILAYIGLLCIVYLVLRVAYSDLNKIPTYELERLENEKTNSNNINNNNDNDNDNDNEDTTINEILRDIKQNDKNNIIDQNNINKDSKNLNERKKISKDKFNNEVAMQQETKNLENDLKPHVDAKDIPNKGSGNVVDGSAAKIAQKQLIV